ncbi:MAG: outer membrane lipoprotein-sorting protein [Acidobacteriia bacterium]|nr:outer membrane lipoprotein-sorting protein [Terriglobia bacterium]
MRAEEPPADLVRRVAHAETETQRTRDHYTYRQSVTLEELSDRGSRVGEYREVRDVIFSPAEERTEEIIGQPLVALKNLKMTDEDFADMRNIQPFVLVEDLLAIYETKFRGEETMDDVDCYVLQVRPRQILSGQRLFDGLLWVKKDDFAIVRSEGQAVPQVRSMKQENLFPRFTTVRRPVDGKHWFPVYTHADDTLAFRTGPQRIRLMIRYSEYKRFGSESTITFGKGEERPQH